MGAVLPHKEVESNQLADETSHLTLSTTAGPANALVHPSAAATVLLTQGEDPSGTSPSRRRACSTTCCDVNTVSLIPQHARQSAPSIEPLLPSTAPTAALGADAQSSPPISHEHAREETRMRDARVADGEEDKCDPMQYADPADTTLSELLIAAPPSYGYPWVIRCDANLTLGDLPNEVLLHILSYLDVCDLLATSRTSHQFRDLALAPFLHRLRLRNARAVLPPLLTSPSRPSLPELIARSIFLTHTTVVSRKLARSLTAIRLSRRLAVRPPPEALVARSVLPPECLPGQARVSPALVAKTRAVERERVKDGLRRWVGSVWERRWREKAEDRRRWEERCGVGRVWRLRRFWERVGRGEIEAH